MGPDWRRAAMEMKSGRLGGRMGSRICGYDSQTDSRATREDPIVRRQSH